MLVIDRGEYAIVRPIPEDPIAALHGAHSGSGPAAEEVRDAEREADEAIEQHRTTQQ